jgi:hypothetical protein
VGNGPNVRGSTSVMTFSLLRLKNTRIIPS